MKSLIRQTCGLLAVWTSTIALLACGCGTVDFPAALGGSTLDVDRIVGDADLTGQEKRDQLAALGFSQTTINALLRDTRTANQFGGTLTTAFNKLTSGRLNELTPDEIQIYADAAEDAGGPSVNIADDAALGIADFFIANSILTREDLEQVLADPSIEIPGIISVGSLTDVFVDFDPNEVIEQLP